jgi:tripartite-type tricarboxylate transporter receptor subunit TctC
MKCYLVVLLALLIPAAVFGNGKSQASASGYPNRQIDLLVNSNPGAASDTFVRTLAPFLEKHLGVPVVVTNKTGAGGQEMLIALKNARPDGYTWGAWTLPAVVLYCTIGNLKGNVNVLTDYREAGTACIDYTTIITRKGLGYKTVPEIINASKAKPNTMIYGRSGPGGTDDVFCRALQQQGASFHVIDGYITFGTALLGGHVDVMVDSLSSTYQAYKDNGLDIVGVGSDERLPELPDIPTYKEQGFDAPIPAHYRYVFGPAAIPDDIANIFIEGFNKAAQDPEFIERATKINFRPRFIDSKTTTELKHELVKTFKSIYEE